MNLKNRNKSFTLIEILIVVVVVGIISSFIIVGISSVSYNGAIAKSKVFLENIRSTLILDLASEWRFEGNTNDYHSGGYTGTRFGTGGTNNLPQFVSAGIYDQCIDFDGTDDYVDFGTIYGPSRTINRTYSFWVYPKTLSGGTVFTTGNLYYTKCGHSLFRLLSSGTRISYDFNISPYYYDFPVVAELNKWNYFVLMVDVSNATNSVFKLYKNSQYIGSTTQERATGGQTLKTFLMGAQYANASDDKLNFLNGRIDEFVIYNDIMSIALMKNNYFSQANKFLSKKEMEDSQYSLMIKELTINE